MTIEEQQADQRRAFVGGGPGVFVSGSTWIVAALVERSHGTQTAFAALFIGGMMIFPVSSAICRLLFRRAASASGNALGGLGLESTIMMIGGLFAAWLFLDVRPELTFPIAAIAVGTHYLPFRTIYGDRLFWLLGGLITAVGVAGIVAAPPWLNVILAVGVVELVFGVALTLRDRMARRAT